MKSYGHVSTTAALAALLLLLGVLALPTHAAVYTTSLTATQPPGVYTGTPALGGLFTACENVNRPDAVADSRYALVLLSSDMAGSMPSFITAGTYYLSAYYDAAMDAWYWLDRNSEDTKAEFALSYKGTPINSVVASNWAAGYPKPESGTAIGSLKYVAYDANLKGWINVDGTQPLSGVACQSRDSEEAVSKKGFPWWGILIIVLGSVAIIAVVVVVVVCCCCKKRNRKRSFDDDEDATTFGSRSSSFSSRGTSHTDATSSRGTSGYTSRGSEGTDADSSYSEGSSKASSSQASTSQASSSRGSYATGSSSMGSRSRTSSRTSSTR